MIGTHPPPPSSPLRHPYQDYIRSRARTDEKFTFMRSFPFPTGRTEGAAEIEPINNIEAIYGRSRVKVKVEPRLTFTFTRGLSYIASILLTDVNFTCVAWKNYARVEINPISGSTRGWRPLMWACTFCSNFLLMQKRSWQKVSPDTFDFFFVVVTLARS